MLEVCKQGCLVMDRHAEQCKQPDMIGKGAARKLLELDAVPDPNEAGHKAHALEGDDLKVGGKGIKDITTSSCPPR